MTKAWTDAAMTDEAMPVIEQMPDLSSLSGRRLIRRLLGQLWLMMWGTPLTGVPQGELAHLHYKLFLRIADKLVAEYEAGRTELTAYVRRPENNLGETLHFVAASDHFENVFNSLARALTLLDLLKRERSVPVTSDDLKPFAAAHVRRIRNAVEHIDDFLRHGEILMTDDIMLRPWCEGVEFADVKVTYVELARWITRIHEIAERLLAMGEQLENGPSGSSS
jgi:hypothetical protein